MPTSRSDLYAPFDVVVVPYPYTDRLAEKRRPAVIVSAPELLRKYGLLWLVMVTSASNPRWDCDVDVSDLQAAGLPAPSLLRPAKIATADGDRVIRRIGHLSARDVRGLKSELKLAMAR